MTSQLEKLFEKCDKEVVMFKIKGCVNCPKLQMILESVKKHYKDFVFDVIDLSKDIYEDEYDYDELINEICNSCANGSRQFPKLFIKGSYWGTYEDARRRYDFDGLKSVVVKLGIGTSDDDDF